MANSDSDILDMQHYLHLRKCTTLNHGSSKCDGCLCTKQMGQISTQITLKSAHQMHWNYSRDVGAVER